MMAVELFDEEQTNKLVQHFLDEGLITDRFLFMPTAFRIAPPLNISAEQVEETAATIISCQDKL
jgi:4-aminobutyrate aminotransferase-like enzyme